LGALSIVHSVLSIAAFSCSFSFFKICFAVGVVDDEHALIINKEVTTITKLL
jgi:hypothetical protein